MSSSLAMASIAAARADSDSGSYRSAEASTRGSIAMSPGVQKAWTPGVDSAKWTPRSMSASVAAGSYHECAQREAV
jgi:hypothetical protein